MIVQEIQDLKHAGYSLNEVINYLAGRSDRTSCRATVYMNLNLNSNPDSYTRS